MSIQRKKQIINFHRSTPMQCPYLPGHEEQQLFVELWGADAQGIFQKLSENGFRRSHHIAYRPVCNACQACVSVRIPVARFEWGKSFRRCWNKNQHLVLHDIGQKVTPEHFSLFRRYVRARHQDGEMAMMSYADYEFLIRSSPVDSHLLEWRAADGTLVAACLADKLKDGYSAVYSYFDPALDNAGLGNFIILSLIEKARAENFSYVYLGYYISNSTKMAYKARFKPLEHFENGLWAMPRG